MNTIISLPVLLQELKNKFPDNISETAFVQAFTATIIEGLKKDGKVEIKGLGTFQLLNSDVFESKKSSDLIKFIPDNDTAEIVNQPFAFFEAVELDDDITDEILNESDVKNQYDNKEDNEEDNKVDNDVDFVDSEEEIKNDLSPDSSTESENINNLSDENLNIQQEEQANLNNVGIEVPQDVEETAPVEPILDTENTLETDHNDLPDENANKSWLLLLVFFILGLTIGYLISAYVINPTKEEIIVQHDTIYVESSPIVPDSIQNISEFEQKQVLDTIKANRFLATMARNHYGRMEFWVYIYLENKDVIKNPNHIPLGTTVVIPPASKYGIDPNSQKSVEDAEIKCNEVLNTFSK